MIQTPPQYEYTSQPNINFLQSWKIIGDAMGEQQGPFQYYQGVAVRLQLLSLTHIHNSRHQSTYIVYFNIILQPPYFTLTSIFMSQNIIIFNLENMAYKKKYFYTQFLPQFSTYNNINKKQQNDKQQSLNLILSVVSIWQIQMNIHKKQVLQRQIAQQSGQQTLDLNDLVLGYDGARILGALLPQYHKNLRHIRLNGNNIDAQGFQIIFSGLLHCPYLKSIQAEWNSMGSADVGLASLCNLITNLHYLQFIDLKNNRISHHLATYIAQIIQMNRKTLKVIDLRWNQLGELGAKQILTVLPLNKNIKFLGLEDNRISMGTLMEIQSILKSGTYDQGRVLRHSNSLPNAYPPQYFPISADQYPSMDVQLKTGQIRSKIENQNKQAGRYTQKIQVQIQKILQKIKLKAAQIGQMQLKFDGLAAQNAKITSQLRQAERMLALQKQRAFGIQTKFNNEKSQMRNQKYKLNNSIQNVMQKYTQRNQRELQQIELVMGQKLDRLNAFLKERLHQKRTSRDKLTELKQDIMKFKINKQDVSNKGITSQSISTSKSAWDQQTFVLQEQIAKVKTTMQNQIKKGQYMSKQLNNQIIKALNKQQNIEKQIFEVQNKIKGIHHGMALKNLQLQKNLAELRLKQSQIYDKQATIDMETKYLKYLQSQGNVKIQIQSMIHDQIIKGNQTAQEDIQMRIADIQRALRAQQAQNRMIKNQYEKLMVQLQNVAKKNIQLVLFQ